MTPISGAWPQPDDEMESGMTKTLKQFVASLPENEQKKIASRTEQLIVEEMSLRDLRKSVGQTQVMLAKRLKVGQDAISKIETRSDMYISTLRSILKAMGGELELVARFSGRPPVRLEELGAPVPRVRRGRRKAA